MGVVQFRAGGRAAAALLATTCAVSAPSAPVRAEPTAPTTVCEVYPDMPDCEGRVPTCTLCHDSTDPPAWNSFGTALKGQLTSGVAFDSALRTALAAVADDDSDGDGVSNAAELAAGTSPSVANVATPAHSGGSSNPRYRIGAYDPAFALRRVSTLYCGRSPSYDEVAALNAGAPDAATSSQRIHDALTRCLASDYWRNEGLLRLADKRIRPVRAFGNETDIIFGDLRIVIGNYDYDYNLWRYALTEGHDMREMLTAQFHLEKAKDGSLQKVEGVIAQPDPNAVAGGQPVEPEHRAGLLTTQWFLAYNTMFSPLPRVTAAQAYRSFLGADIASNEGLRPVAGEPSDVDKKGVTNPRCANCHSTLDPLAYAFAEYEGINTKLPLRFGAYDPSRPATRIPDWNPARQQSVVLGTPVKNLVEWAHVASESDEFKRAIADMFFRHALGRAPLADEIAEFNKLWQSAASDGYSADKLLQRLVDSNAFGSP